MVSSIGTNTVTVTPPTPAVVAVSEPITVTDSPSLPDIGNSENVKISDQVKVYAFYPIAITPASVLSGVVGHAYPLVTFTGTGGHGALTLSQAGNIPGVQFSASGSTVMMSGKPTAASPAAGFAFAISGTDSVGNVLTLNYLLPVAAACPTITVSPSGTLSTATIGTPYSQIFTAAGGVGTITWSTPTILPSGITFSSGGVLTVSGSLAPGTVTLNVIATDQNGCQSASTMVSLLVVPPPAAVMVNEKVTITDLSSFPDVALMDGVKITDVVQVQALNTTTTSLTIPAVVYGNSANVTVSVGSSTASVTGTVTLSVDGGTPSSMALSSDSATFNLGVLKAGNHTLAANFTAQGSFLASSVPGTLTVSPASLTITANSATRQYGQPNPTFTVTYSGFVNGDTAAALTGILTCTTSLTPSTPANTMPITCSGLTSSNYNITYVAGTLTITPAPLTVTANNATRSYGQANPVFTATYSGLVNGDAAASLGGALSCTTTATPASAVTTYPITCSGQSSANYSVKYVPGTLSVNGAPLIITANNATKNFNTSNPTFTWTASGFVNGENTGVITTNPTCTTTATTTSPAGSYPITCSGAVAANYTITYVAGTLTIVCHYASVSFSPASIALGGTVNLMADVQSCAATTQTVTVQFRLSGPLVALTCALQTVTLFTTPAITLPPNTVQKVSFPFVVPKVACTGNYTVISTTSLGGKVVDTSTATLTVH